MKVDTTIKLYHVGGRGDTIGPADCLLKQLGNNVMLTVFEADSGVENAGLHESFDSNFGGKIFIMPRCISGCVGKRKFYINEDADSSSLFRLSPMAENYIHKGVTRWGQTCKLAKTIEVDVTTLDGLYMNGELPLPDFISLDAQGAEYDIIKGASKSLQGDMLGVVTEVEFREIYHGQKLFADQDALLRKYQFSLYDFYNVQHWYASPYFTNGIGALMVAEALYLRDFHYFTDRKNSLGLTSLFSTLLKLIIVASCFSRYSYANEIIRYAKERWITSWEGFIQENPHPYLNELMDILSFSALMPFPDTGNIPCDIKVIKKVFG